jgi:hypothetical protein
MTHVYECDSDGGTGARVLHARRNRNSGRDGWDCSQSQQVLVTPW